VSARSSAARRRAIRCERRRRRRILDVRAADLSKKGASAASTSPSGELCAGGDEGTTLFRSVSSDEDGGNSANIAASGASNQTPRMREQRINARVSLGAGMLC
jgi:hypothetical protein